MFESLCLGYGENIGVLSETVVSQNAKSWKIELGLGYRQSYSSFDFDPRVVLDCLLCVLRVVKDSARIWLSFFLENINTDAAQTTSWIIFVLMRPISLWFLVLQGLCNNTYYMLVTLHVLYIHVV